MWTKNNRDPGIVDTLPPSTSKQSNHGIGRGGVIPLNGLMRGGRGATRGGGRSGTVGEGGTRTDVCILIIQLYMTTYLLDM